MDCLESIKGDRYERIEIVLIDDGSADRSFEIAASWLTENSHYFESVCFSRQANAGVCITLNRLVSQSSGEFIFPLASDDEVAEDGIFQCVHYYKKHCTQPTLLFSDVELIDQHGAPIAVSGSTFVGRDPQLLTKFKQYLRLDVMTQWGIPYAQQFFTRRHFESLGGYNEKIAYEDLDFAMKNVARGTVAYAPFKSRRYRIRPGFTATPGISAEDYSQAHGRKESTVHFKFPHNILLVLLAFRDSPESGSFNASLKYISRQMLALITRSARYFFRIVNRVSGI